jgi:hypothetical protein
VVGASFVPIACVCGALTWIATAYSADYTHAAISSVEGSPAPQPPGSLLLYKVPSSAAAALDATYRQLGGRRTETYLLPVDAERVVRAASARLTMCLLDGRVTSLGPIPPDCSTPESASDVNVIALTDAPGVADVVADPTLIEEGRVGVLSFLPESPVPQQKRLVDAAADAQLGGNMPGAVVALESRTAREWGLTAGDSRLLAFIDFSVLDRHDQALFRSAIRQLASTAQVAEDSEYYMMANRNLAIGRAIALAGACVLAFVIALGGGSIVEANASLRRTLVDIGASRRQRRRLALQLVTAPLAATFLAAAAGWLSAWITGIHDGSGFGWVWVLPALAATIAWAAIGRSFLSVPPHDSAATG